MLVLGQWTSTASLLAGEAERRGVRVVGPGDLAGVVDSVVGRSVHWYGGPRGADRVGGRLGLGLLEPPDDWLVRLPREFTGRRVVLTSLAEAWAGTSPVFVKPPSEKSFPAAVYADGSRLPRSGDGVGPETSVLVSEVVAFAGEYRLFVLDGRVVAASRYAVHGRLDPAPLDQDAHEREVRAFAERLLAATGDELPSAVAVDVGLLRNLETRRESWAVVEANMAWFAHSYAADPGGVLDVVLRATGPRRRFAARDRGFLRAVRPPSW